MKKIHLILSGLSLTIILLSLNRLTTLTLSYLQPYDFLRWLDFNAMIPIPLLSVIFYYLLKKQTVYDSPFLRKSTYLFLNILFISGVYLFGAGSGDHEVTNYLNARFCDFGKTRNTLCNIISFNDDEFSHIIYYLGFIFLNLSLIFIEYNLPRKQAVSRRDLWLIGVNASFIALGIFANLAFEPTIMDIIVFSSMMLVSLYLLFLGKHTYNRLPVIFYFAAAYSLGILSTVIYKLLYGGLF